MRSSSLLWLIPLGAAVGLANSQRARTDRADPETASVVHMPPAPPAPAPPALPLQPLAPPVSPVKVAKPVVDEPRHEFTTEEIVARCEGAIAVIRSERGIGTGFLVRPGVLVTNAHVIEGATIARLRVAFPSQPSRSRNAAVKELLFEDPARDLAVLRVDSSTPPLVLESSYRFRRGQEVTVIGSPGTGSGDILENAVSRGVMSTSITHKGQPYYQMSIAINPGNSGGPVIGSEGRVVGVASMKDITREGIAFCIPADGVAVALRRMETVTLGSVARIHSQGAARSLNAKLDSVARVYENTLESIAGIIDEGHTRGFGTERVTIVAEQAFRKKYGEDLHHFTATTLYGEVCRTLADRDLPRQVVDDLGSLWKVILELQRHAEQPRGEGNTLRSQCQALRERHESLVRALRLAVGGVAAEEAAPSSRHAAHFPPSFPTR